MSKKTLQQSKSNKKATAPRTNRCELDLAKTLINYIKQNIPEANKIAIACSAGIDSMVLLDSLIKVHPPELIYCIHLDHGLREDSHEADDFLKLYCKEQGIHYYSKNYAQGQLAQDENSAREARYQFYSEAAQELGFKDIMSAHHLDDDVETIVFRLIRGTSSYGLKGIPSSRDLNQKLKIHRPFLQLGKSEIYKYAQKESLKYIEDSSNQELNYDRNKIRKQILPLCEEINASTKQNISQLSQIISEEQEYLEEKASKALEELGELPWQLSDLRLLAKTILRRVLEKKFTSKIRFCNEFMQAIADGGFHRINYESNSFFVIKQKQVYLE